MNRIKSITAKGALAFALLTGSLPLTHAVYAEEQAVDVLKPTWTVKAATTFFDVPASHWASKEIAKMTMLDIISGYNGLFDPNKDVSHQHVLVMAVKMLGYAQEAQAVNVDTVAVPFNVDSMYKGYVYTAIKHGLISPTEIKDTTGTWGKDNASREWVAQIVVRVANKDLEAQQKTQAPSAFKDGDTVSADYRGYVNAAFDLGFVSGRPDGTFGPQTAVTRASAAIMLSKAGDLLSPLPGYPVSGTVISNDAGTLKMMTEAGTERTYTLSQQTLVYSGTTSLAASTLRAGNLIRVIAADSSAYYVDLVNQQGPVVTTGEGMVTALQADAKKITVTSGTVTNEYEATEAAWGTISTVVVGDKLSYQIYGTKIVSARIIPVIKGELRDVKKDGKESYITLLKSDDNYETIRFSNTVKVTSAVKTNAQISDLFQGDKLVVELDEAKVAVKIDVTQSSVENEYMATLVDDINKANNFITVKTSKGDIKVYMLDERTRFVNANGTESAIDDKTGLASIFLKERKFDLTANGNRLLKVKLSSYEYSGKVKFFDRNSGQLMLEMADKTVMDLIVRNTATVTKTDAKAGTLADIVTGNNIKVRLFYTGNEVVDVTLVP